MATFIFSVVQPFSLSDSDPVCTGPSSPIALEGETLTYECMIEFQGVWSPQMTWEGSIQGAIAGDTTGSTETVTISKIQVTAEIQNNGEVFSCLTNFGPLDPEPGNDEATNAITYSSTQEWPAISVHCKFG